MDAVIEGGAQKQQLINVECAADFSLVPGLSISFLYGAVPQRVSLKLPIMASKFLEPTAMDAPAFFQRWKLLGAPAQECQKVVKAAQAMERDAVRARLAGAGLGVLPGVDPNAENFVCAAVMHTTGAQIGCLARLEPNAAAAMYRLTVRASREGVAARLVELLETQL